MHVILPAGRRSGGKARILRAVSEILSDIFFPIDPPARKRMLRKMRSRVRWPVTSPGDKITRILRARDPKAKIVSNPLFTLARPSSSIS
jgi:hypothetical protein